MFDIDEVLQSALTAVLWLSPTEDRQDFLSDCFDTDDFATATVSELKKDLEKFLLLAGSRLAAESYLDSSQIGHDFVLSLSGTGSGFSDRNISDDLKEFLDVVVSDNFVSWEFLNFFVADDGLIYSE